MTGSWLSGLDLLARELWEATESAAVVDAIATRSPSAIGMDHADVTFLRSSALVSSQIAWPLDEDFHTRYAATPLTLHLPTTEAARTATSVFVDDLVAYQAGHPDLRADVVRSGFRSAAAIPLRDYQGTVLGVLGLVSMQPVTFDAERRAAIELTGELCGAALRRVDIAARSIAMSTLAAHMAGAPSGEEVAAVLRDRGPKALGALLVNCRLLDERGKALISPIETKLAEPLRQRYETIPLRGDLPLTDCVLTNEAVWLADPAAIAERYPAIEADARTAGFEALAALPMHDSSGAVTGALAVAWPKPIRVDAFFESTVTTVAELASQAIERARNYDAEHALVTKVQQRLLGELPQVPGVAMAAHYLPASRSAGVGGDWYDVVEGADRRISAVMGDASGHGIEAATSMTQVRTVVTGLLRAGHPLETLLDQAERMLDARHQPFATFAVAEVDLDERRLRYIGAGHPWMLLRRADGTVLRLDGAQRALLGAHGGSIAPADADFGPGDLLVLYTDGLVERRGKPIDDGIDELLAELRSARPEHGLQTILDALLRVAPRPPSDDISLLVLAPEG